MRERRKLRNPESPFTNWYGRGYRAFRASQVNRSDFPHQAHDSCIGHADMSDSRDSTTRSPAAAKGGISTAP